ncbi:acid-activated periplasmic chaperone HdeA [Microbulbifer marinus]|nr:acid-activated periplasmic chaperone HdeA [Microbulbifer marinus]
MRFILPFIILGVASSAVVADQHKKKPAKDWTCADFIAIDDQYKPKVVYWATAYSKHGKPEAAVLDIEGTEKVTPMIVTACTNAPNDSFWKKFKEEWHKVDKDTKDEMKKMKDKM